MFKRITLAVAAVAVMAITPSVASAQYYYPDNNRDDQVVGGLIGAGLGAVLGSQVAGSGARTEGSVIGALVGGLAGSQIAGSNSNRGYYGNSGYYNGGYYNRQTGYYSQPYSYSQPTYYSQPRFYQQPSYYQPPRVVYTQPRVIYTQPRFSHYGYSRPYYQPRSGLSININSGPRYHSRPYRYRDDYRLRRRDRRRHYRHH